MALGNKSSSNATFLTTFGGKIVREWRKEEPKAEYIPEGKELKHRTTNKGNEVWYVEFDYLAGSLKKVELDDEGDFGARIKVHVQDVDENYILTLPVQSSAGMDFLMKMEAIDLSKEVSFEPWRMDAATWKSFTGKDSKNGKAGLTIKQNDEKIAKYYTKDDNKGMPEIIIKKVGKETKIDDADRMIFLYEKLDQFIAAVDAKSAGNTGNMTGAQAPTGSNAKEEEDDLPF
jgi:hypothetical protein